MHGINLTTEAYYRYLHRYQEAADKNKYGYEIKFYDHLQGLCNDLDKKIRKGNERLSVRPDDSVSDSKKQIVRIGNE